MNRSYNARPIVIDQRTLGCIVQAMDNEQIEKTLFTTFHRFEEFASLQNALLEACSPRRVEASTHDSGLLLVKLNGIVGGPKIA